ncbi:hypothetical protein C2U35_22580, partial [Ralstonia solanacearum]
MSVGNIQSPSNLPGLQNLNLNTNTNSQQSGQSVQDLIKQVEKDILNIIAALVQKAAQSAGGNTGNTGNAPAKDGNANAGGANDPSKSQGPQSANKTGNVDDANNQDPMQALMQLLEDLVKLLKAALHMQQPGGNDKGNGVGGANGAKGAGGQGGLAEALQEIEQILAQLGGGAAGAGLFVYADYGAA